MLEKASVDDAIEPPLETECFTYAATKSTSFLKVILRETEDMLIFDNNAYTVLKDADERAAVEEDNEQYAYLTVGKGRQRKTTNAEAQTNQTLLKSRSVNTDHIKHKSVSTFVSNYEMFDTYADLERHTQSLEVEGADNTEKLDITTYSLEGSKDLDKLLCKSKSFKLSSMILQRILASNVYRERQRRFRNMDESSPLNPEVHYLYRIEPLFVYKTVAAVGKAVSSFSWCPSDSDILAVGYGVYNARPNMDRSSGVVCLWNIKNPVNPERFYKYPVPVTALAFSKEHPQLLAVGLYDGSIEITDITDGMVPVTVYTSQRSTSPAMESVCQIQWIQSRGEDEILAATQDGFVIRYTLTNSPYLIGSQMMLLERVEGAIEGLPVEPRKYAKLQANRHAQILTLEISPIQPDTYYVGTDEGCIRKCSTFYPNQHQHVLQVHQYSVTCMEFSQWSSRIFLTCGTDWFIRIWIDGILEPIIELTSGLEPVQCARWSPNNSTIIACTKRTKLEIWDLTTNVLVPVSSHNISEGNEALTICDFTKCGKSIVVGDSVGSTFVYAVEDMPFPSHFQYKALEKALVASLSLKPGLLEQVLGLGDLGY